MNQYIEKLYLFSLYYLLFFAYPLRLIFKINTLFFFDFIYVLLFFIILINKKKKTTKIIKIFNLLFLFYIIFIIISLSSNKVSNLVKISALRMQLIAFISFLLPQYLNNKNFFYNVFLNLGIPVSLIGIKQFFFGFSKYEKNFIMDVRNIDINNSSAIKIFSTIGSPNTFAYFIVITLAIVLFYPVKIKFKKTLLLLLSTSIFLSKMSIAVICLLLIFSIYLIFLCGKKIRNLYLFLLPLFLYIIHFILVYLEKIFINYNFFIETLIMVFENRVGDTHSMNARRRMIEKAIEDTNIYTGNGLGYIGQNINRPYILDNHYMKIYSEIGIFGMITFILTILSVLIYLLYCLKKYKVKDIIVDILIILVTSIFMLTSNLLDNTSCVIIFYSVLGFSLSHNYKKEMMIQSDIGLHCNL